MPFFNKVKHENCDEKKRIMKKIKNILLIFWLQEKFQVDEKSESLLNCIKSRTKTVILSINLLLSRQKELKPISKMTIFLNKVQRKFSQMYLTNCFLNLG